MTPSDECPPRDVAISSIISLLSASLPNIYRYYDKEYDENNPIVKNIIPGGTNDGYRFTGPVANTRGHKLRLLFICGAQRINQEFTVGDISKVVSFQYSKKNSPGSLPETRLALAIDPNKIDKIIKKFGNDITKKCQKILDNKCQIVKAIFIVFGQRRANTNIGVDIPLIWRQ